MPFYDFTVVKNQDCLTDVDKNRLVCLLLACDSATISATANWDKATTEFGAKSTESMRVMVRSVLKKIENAGGKLDGDVGRGSATSSASTSGSSAPVTPVKKGRAAKVKTPKSSTKKRRVADSLTPEPEGLKWSGGEGSDDEDEIKVKKIEKDGDDEDEFEVMLAA